MNRREDTALDALARLRDDVQLDAPDEALLARLTAGHRVQDGARSARPRWPFWLGALVLTSGAAVAAGGGLERLRGWWLTVEGDGRVVHDAEFSGGGRDLALLLDDGTQARVQVEAGVDPVDGSESLRVSLSTEGPAGSEHEVTEDVVQHAPALDAPVDPLLLTNARHLHFGPDRDGREAHLFLLAAGVAQPEIDGDALLVALHEDGDEPSARIVGTAPGWTLDPDAEVRVQPLEGGGARLLLRTGPEREAVVLWDAAPEAHPDPELSTRDGRLRVRLRGLPETLDR